jgi:hypothetical protein
MTPLDDDPERWDGHGRNGLRRRVLDLEQAMIGHATRLNRLEKPDGRDAELAFCHAALMFGDWPCELPLGHEGSHVGWRHGTRYTWRRYA